MRVLPLALILSASLAWGADETIDQQIAVTDFANADSVFALGQWCQDHNLPVKSRQYFKQAIKVDKDHEGARAALGQIRVGERWVTAPPSKIAAGNKPSEPEVAGRKSSSPGPTAAQVTWDLTPPQDPHPENTFINSYIDRLPTVHNDSREMDAAIATMVSDENLPVALPRLCVALLRKDYNDLYGGSMMIMELLKKNDTRRAKLLVPFLTKASEHVNEAEDLSTFAYAVGNCRERKAIPRLIELMNSGNAEVKAAATTAVAALALLPEKSLTPERAKAWWDLNHAVSDQQIFSEQLRSSDAKIAVEAAKALYDLRDKSIVPVLIKLLRSDDIYVCTEAIFVIQRITGQDWTYDPASGPDLKKKRADSLEKWWKDEQFRFVWIDDRKAQEAQGPAVVIDQNVTWVALLGSVEGNQSQQAEGNLTAKGNAAAPALIEGLSSASPIVRRKCGDLLRTITKQDIAFDTHAPDEERAKSIEAWKIWARTKGLIKDADAKGDQAVGDEAKDGKAAPEEKRDKRNLVP